MTTHLPRSAIALACALALAPLTATASGPEADGPIVVNVDNFNRAQTDHEFAGILKLTGGINKLLNNRAPTPIDKQNVIRMNRDTLYSMAVVDISNGATVTIAGGRQTLYVLNGRQQRRLHQQGVLWRRYIQADDGTVRYADLCSWPFARSPTPKTRRIWL